MVVAWALQHVINSCMTPSMALTALGKIGTWHLAKDSFRLTIFPSSKIGIFALN